MSDLTVYFDGACPVCAREMAFYRRFARTQVIWHDIHAADEAALGPGLSMETALARFHVRTGDGQLISGAAAFLRLYRSLHRFRWLGYGLVPAQPLLELAYRGFLKLRPWMPAAFQTCRDDACELPSQGK